MSGSQKNEWKLYLNGKTPHYNFSYKSNSISDIPMMPIPNSPLQVSTSENVKEKNINNEKMINTQINKNFNKKINGGKRKSRRHTKNKHRK